MSEYSRLWKSEQPGIELLCASFQSFSFARHWHDELSIGVIERGAEGLNYRGSNLIIPEKQIVAINPAEVHTGFAGCESGWTYRMFYFDVAFLSELLDQEASVFLPFIRQPVIDDPELYQQLLNLHSGMGSESLNLARESLLLLTLRALFQRHGDARSDIEGEGLDSMKARRMQDYLSEHWRENPGIDQLVELTGLSKYQVIRHFSAHFGITPHQFLIGKKVIQARRLLGLGWSCADTALECGFFDQSHMSRNFKKVYGASPGKYGG